MSEKMTFLGFTDPWKQGQEASVPGFGSVAEGQTVDVPDDLVDWLLTTHRWVKAAADAEPSSRLPESDEPAPETSQTHDPFVGATRDEGLITTGPDAGATVVTGEATTTEGAS